MELLNPLVVSEGISYTQFLS